MTSNPDPVLNARLDLVRCEATLAKAQRKMETWDVLTVAAITLAGIVVAPVVALLAAASSSDFEVPDPWSLILKVCATSFVGLAGLVGSYALSLRDGVETAAGAVARARTYLTRVERAAENEQADQFAAKADQAGTFWAWLRARQDRS